MQVAGTLVLLIATGLCLRSFAKLSSLDLGFNPAQVLTFSVNGLDEEQFPSRAARYEVVERLLANVEQLPQVRAAGAVYERPFEHGPIGMDSGVLLEGQPDTPDEINRNGVLNWESVTSRYFESMNIRLLRGRIFDERDSAGAGLSAIVSEATANRLWPGQDPIGKQLRLSLTEDDRWHTVVGVVATARYREIANPRSDLYVPMRQSTIDVKHFTVRTTGDPLSAAPAVAATVRNVDARLSIGGVTTMDAVVRRVRGPWHFTLIVFALFGLIAVALAVIGLFATVSYAVTRRSREIGVRMALGATPGRVVRLMLVQGAGPAAAGLLAGAAASRALSRARPAAALRPQRQRRPDVHGGRVVLRPGHHDGELPAGAARRAHRSAIGAAARVKRASRASRKQPRCSARARLPIPGETITLCPRSVPH